jgi:hypothetical protein
VAEQHREGVGKCLGAFVGRARGGQEGHARGRARCPVRCISSPNLRLKWVHADTFGQRLFGSPSYTDYFIRANAFGDETTAGHFFDAQ